MHCPLMSISCYHVLRLNKLAFNTIHTVLLTYNSDPCLYILMENFWGLTTVFYLQNTTWVSAVINTEPSLMNYHVGQKYIKNFLGAHKMNGSDIYVRYDA